MPIFNNNHAILECRRTPWDEKIFNFPCAEITNFQVESEAAGIEVLFQFEQWAEIEQLKFAYGRFQPTRLVKQLVHHAGFYFAEASYRLRHYKLKNTQAFDKLIRSGPSLEKAKESDYEALRTIMADDFKHGRIHEDPWVDSKASSHRNRNWLNDLVAQLNEIYVYRLKDEIIGLHIQRSENQKVCLVLTGVKSSHALLGVSLWAEVLKLNRLRSVCELYTIISIANIPIINLYRLFEFQFEELLVGFHKRWDQPSTTT